MVFFRIFRAISTRKTASLLVGFGASAVGIRTALGISYVAERKKKVDSSKFMAEPLTDVQRLEKSMDDMKSRMEVMILGVQADICRRLAAIDGNEFRVDRWVREQGGGGVSCVLQDGKTYLEPSDHERLSVSASVGWLESFILGFSLGHFP